MKKTIRNVVIGWLTMIYHECIVWREMVLYGM